MQRKLKPLLPSLREKKRYLAFEVISKDKMTNPGLVEQKISHLIISHLGQQGAAQAGMIFLKDRYDPERQRGLLRVSTKRINDVRAALLFSEDVIFHTVGISGILKKAVNNYIREG